MTRFVVGFARFWWDFIVGDDWRIAAGVVLVLGLGAVLVAGGDASDPLVAALTAAGIMLVAMGTIVSAALRATRR
jgi:hypothetical protein